VTDLGEADRADEIGELAEKALVDLGVGESPDNTRNPDWSGRRESNSRSQLGKLMFCR
jgi:hypothetical protein